jgi:predicted aminopeptidase
MNAARPVDDWLRDPATPAPLQAQLRLAQQLRAFASSALHLPDNASYQGYADLRRRAAVWNVAAAPADSLTLKTWCFAVVGCVSYRGYFDEARAQALGQALARQGWEVSVYPVPAYSTLGWLNGLGGDPLLSTFIGYPEGDLAGLLFHELAHQKLYVDGDSAFNESFATAVERLGARQWLRGRPAEVRQAWRRGQAHRQQMRALQQRTREALAALYARKAAGDGTDGLDEAMLRTRKAEVYADFHTAYAALKADWAARGEPDARWDRWVAGANNASFGMQHLYHGWVPAFEALFIREGCDWPRFHAAAAQLARLPRAQRDEALRRLAQMPSDGPDACEAREDATQE